jgi:hypothetical protein
MAKNKKTNDKYSKYKTEGRREVNYPLYKCSGLLLNGSPELGLRNHSYDG